MFWIGTLIFVGTYIVIASEKVHKSAAAMGGAMLMLLFILEGPSHGKKADASLDQNGQTTEIVQPSEPLVSQLDSFAQNIKNSIIKCCHFITNIVNDVCNIG